MFCYSKSFCLKRWCLWVMKKTPDFILIIVTLSLLTIGMIMVYSASAVWASYKMGTHSFCKKTITVCVLVVAMFFIMKIDYWVWRTYSKVILLVCFILLILVLIPGRSCSRRSTKLDWNRSIFDSTVRIYEVCDDYFLGKVFSRTAKLITSLNVVYYRPLVLCFLLLG